MKIQNVATGESCEINFAHEGFEWEDPSLAEVGNEVCVRLLQFNQPWPQPDNGSRESSRAFSSLLLQMSRLDSS